MERGRILSYFLWTLPPDEPRELVEPREPEDEPREDEPREEEPFEELPREELPREELPDRPDERTLDPDRPDVDRPIELPEVLEDGLEYVPVLPEPDVP